MDQLDLIQTRVLEMQRQSAADFEQLINMARLNYDYHASQLDNLLTLCDHSLKLRGFGRQPEAEPSQEKGNGSLESK